MESGSRTLHRLLHGCWRYGLMLLKLLVLTAVLVRNVVLSLLSQQLLERLVQWEARKAGLLDGDSAPSTRCLARSACTWNCYVTAAKTMVCHARKTTFEGGLAKNVTLISVPHQTMCSLLDFQKQGRPLVVFFGSITCPLFTDKIEEIKDRLDFLKKEVDFLFIYTEEAHPVDGWHFPTSKYNINNHRHVCERVHAASLLADDVAGGARGGVHFTTDTMDDVATWTYGALPMRLFIIKDGIILREGAEGPFGFSPADDLAWVQDYLRSHS